MESKTNQNASELISESTKLASEWMNKASKNLLDLYSRQLDLTFGFYNNLFNNFPGISEKNPWSGAASFVNAGGSLTGFNSPMSLFFPWLVRDNNPANLWLAQAEKFNRTLAEFGKNWMNAFENNLTGFQYDWNAAGEKYRDMLERQWEAVRNTMDAITEAYNQELEFNVSKNKELFSRLNEQFSELLKQNEAYLSDMYKTSQQAAKGDKTKRTEKREIVVSE